MQNYISLVIAAILLAINVAIHKLYQEKSGTSFAAVSKFNAYTGLLSALAGGVAYMLQLISAVNLPAGVLFPFSTGGSIVFTASISTLFFKEKLSKKIIFSTLLCLIGTIMFI